MGSSNKKNRDKNKNAKNVNTNKAAENKAVELSKTEEMKAEEKKVEAKKKKKLSPRDIVIVVLSVISLVLLFLIIYMSRSRDRMISEMLQNNSEYTNDDVVARLSSGIESYLEITEVNSEKWIEIHNTGTDVVDASGITVLIGGEKAATLEEGTTIANDKYLAVEVSKNPGMGESTVVSLANSEGKIFRSIIVPKLTADKSYGLADSENNMWGYFKPSKGAANSATELEFAKYDGISFSAPGGFYNGSFDLELSAGEGETIYYTIDGTEPTKESAVYSDKIKVTNNSGTKYVYAEMGMGYERGTNYFPTSVDAGEIVRAIAVDASGKVTKEASQAYYVGLRQDSDYLNIPVLSVTTNPENLFDYFEGIYVPGRAGEEALIQKLGSGYGNYYNNWKKPAKIEYYEPYKDKTFEMNADMSVIVDDATTGKQKNMRFSMGDADYSKYKGSSVLDYISDKGDIVVVQGGIDNMLKIRTYLIEQLAKGLSVGTEDRQYCAVFIDGEYWGLYYMKATYDAKYIQRKYSLSGKDINVRTVNNYNKEYNDMFDFIVNNDMSVKENYDEAKKLIDVENFAEYICINMYFGNSAFTPSAGDAWRTVASTGTGYADGKWRFLCGSMQSVMNISATETPSMNTFLQNTMQYDLLLQSLLMNKDFCNTLQKKMTTLVSSNFSEENTAQKLEEIVDLSEKPSMASMTRFNSTASKTSFDAEIDHIYTYLEKRSPYILLYTEELAKKGGDIQKAKEYAEEQAAKRRLSGQAEEENPDEENPEGENGEEGQAEGENAEEGQPEAGGEAN